MTGIQEFMQLAVRTRYRVPDKPLVVPMTQALSWMGATILEIERFRKAM